MAPNNVIEADVAIIGAGPAGTAAAVHLGQLGVPNVVLVDRADFPRDKTCGSGLSSKAIGVLKQLGAWDQIEPHAYPIKGLRLVTVGGREMILSDGETTAAVVCLRRVMDEILLRRATGLGVQFVPRFLVRSLIEEGGRDEGRRVVGFRGDDGREVRARYTIVADGGHSRLVPERGPRQLLQAIMGWWEDVPFTNNHVEMVFDPEVAPWYGWLFPETATRVNIGICYADDEHRHNARELFRRFLDRQYAQRLAGARQVGEWKGHPILYSYSIEKLFSPGRLILGEAGRMTHPATGEGIYHGMRTGIMGAEAVRDALTGAVPEERAFAQYQWRCRLAFQASFLGTKLFHKVVESPALDVVAKLGEQPLIRNVVGKLMAQL